MQNEPVNPRDCIFNSEDIHFWDNKFENEEELLNYLKNKDQYIPIYAACDPSLGKSNRKGDYSAIVTIIYDGPNNVGYVLDADLERRTPDKTIKDIVVLHKKRNFRCLAFESNGFQSLIVDQITDKAKEEGQSIAIEKIQNTSDKRARIESLQPLIKNGFIQFSKKQKILLEQLKYYPKGKYDDGLDALQMVYNLCKNNYLPPLKGSLFIGKDEYDDDYYYR